MKLKQLKTIDIEAKEWSDKINGNSYFSSDVTLNYGMDSQEVIKLPFQYGYGDQYYYASMEEVKNLYNKSRFFRTLQISFSPFSRETLNSNQCSND